MRLLTLLFVLCCCSLSAQIQKGDRLLIIEGANNIGRVGPVSSLGGVNHRIDGGYLSSFGSFNYGFALSDRFLLGSNISVLGGFSVGANGGSASNFYVSASPYLRYYLLNRPSMMLFAQASTGIDAGDTRTEIANRAGITVGTHLPLASNLLVSPYLGYFAREGSNSVSAGLALDVRLGRNTRTEAAPVASFGAGIVALGAYAASLGGSKKNFSAGIRIGGQYFLTSRFSAGVSVGAGGGHFDADYFEFAPAFSSRFVNYGGAVGSRYYLTTARRLVWFTEVGAEVEWQRSDFEDGRVNSDLESVRRNVHLSAGAGLLYFLRTNVALELSPQFVRTFERQEYERPGGSQLLPPQDFIVVKTRTSAVRLNIGIQVFLRQ